MIEIDDKTLRHIAVDYRRTFRSSFYNKNIGLYFNLTMQTNPSNQPYIPSVGLYIVEASTQTMYRHSLNKVSQISMK